METCLYTGRVSHSRFLPSVHRFDYGISMVMVDVADIDRGRATKLPWLMGLLMPIRRRDHLRRPQQASNQAPLALQLATLVQERSGIELDPQGSIYLLTGFGFLWHRFNPASFYYCYDSDHSLRCIVAEVTNTPWHEQSHYVLDARGQSKCPELSFSCAKELHVSPFMPMDTRYRWRLTLPGKRLAININVERESQPLFHAAMAMERRPLTTAEVLAALAQQPLMSLSVAMRIYWQALRLWLKSTPFFSHPRYSTGDKP